MQIHNPDWNVVSEKKKKMFIVKLLLDVIFTSAYQQNCQENLQLSWFSVNSFDLRIHWYKVFIGADQVLWCLFWGAFPHPWMYTSLALDM